MSKIRGKIYKSTSAPRLTRTYSVRIREILVFFSILMMLAIKGDSLLKGFIERVREEDEVYYLKIYVSRMMRLNVKLLEAISCQDNEEVERLLNDGANPNATCPQTAVSACHLAAMSGGDALSLLIKFGAEKLRIDHRGRTPLHLAAWAGNCRQVAILLDFPKEIRDKIDNDNKAMYSITEKDIKKLRRKINQMTNVSCGCLKTRLRDWKDYAAWDIKNSLPVIQPGWTPLHAASFCARKHCARLLLAAGANINAKDCGDRTPLDVTGNKYYLDKKVNKTNFTELIKMLLKAGGKFNTMICGGLNNIDTPIHTAVEMGNIKAITKLLNAGAGISNLNTAGLTPLHVCVQKKLENELYVLAKYDYGQVDSPSATVDVKDREGRTVLQAAITDAWMPGVCVALECGANVTLEANDGDTPIHSAAELGDIGILKVILTFVKENDALDYQNLKGETALIKAIIHGREECVDQILRKGASIKIKLPGDVSVFHLAADYGHLNILRILLEHDEKLTKNNIDTAENIRGFAPIHFAVLNNHKDCVDLLLSKNAKTRCQTLRGVVDISYNGLTPLHIAAIHNYADITGLIIKNDSDAVHELDLKGWSPLLKASYEGNRDVIPLLLQAGANLSQHPQNCKRTAIDMIMHKLSKPTEFMEGVFDSYISSNGKDLQDPHCQVRVDYGILMPTCFEQKKGQEMKVIEALLKTGNRYDQRKLLVHPLVESFLYLKWKALLPFFYTIITFYGLFLGSLTIFIISVFFYKDTNDTPPDWLNTTIWSYVVYATITLVLVQELLYINVKSTRYLLQLETWVKFGSLALAVILPYSVSLPEAEWPRHVATLALLLSWLEMMFLLSRFLDWGYYVLIFEKVAYSFVKILLTFMCLIVGFSLSFMVQFRSQMPFEGPWAALVKTIVMMTSEFDYGALFYEEHSKELATSLIILRIIFLVFLILAAIVLMNLLGGVAVNDINDLEMQGKTSRLAKEVEFQGTLDTLVYNGIFSKILPRWVNNKLKHKIMVKNTIVLSPRKASKLKWQDCESLPSEIRETIFNKAQSQMKQSEDKFDSQKLTTVINKVCETILQKKKSKSTLDMPKNITQNKDDDIEEYLDDINDAVSELKGQTKESRGAVEKLDVKMDHISLEIKAIKKVLEKLESKN